MAQQFITLDDAAEKLGASKDQLNELREAGQLRAYRDGSSWKFRSEEIDKLAEEGLPEIAADSGIGDFGAGLADDTGLGDPGSSDDNLSLDLGDDALDKGKGDSPERESDSGLELSKMEELGDLDIDDDVGASIELSEGAEISQNAGASDLDLAPVDEPTVAADEASDEAAASTGADEGSDADLVLDVDGSGDDAESILLSEAELGGSSDRPPSTIIGRSELATDDDDLQLAPTDSSAAAGVSDVRLVDPDEEKAAAKPEQEKESDSGEDILALESEASGSEVLPGGSAPMSGKFEDLEELEIDLEAESSRILEAEDVAAAQAAQKAQQESKSSAAESDLSLAPTDSEIGLGGLSGVGSDDNDNTSGDSLTGFSSLGTDEGGSGGSLTGLSSIELAEDEDDDFVLGDSGSDITLAGGDSGINLMPSDSGISLDDASLGGAAFGSSIDLGDIGSKTGMASGIGQSSASGSLASSEEFLLTPMGDEEDEDDEDSSQIIALEAVEDDAQTEDSLLGGAAALQLDGAEAGELAMAGTAPVAATEETAFPMWIMALLGSCLTVMFVCGVMMVDVVRNVWSWEEPYSASSAIISGLLSMF